MGGNDEIAAMDHDLPESTILLFRRLAHAKVGVGGKQLLVHRTACVGKNFHGHPHCCGTRCLRCF